eukprot:gene29234-38729_t
MNRRRIAGIVALVALLVAALATRGFGLIGRRDAWSISAFASRGGIAAEGAILARLDPAPLQDQLYAAQAQVAVTGAELDKRRNGNRPQDIAQAQAKLADTEASLASAKEEYDRRAELVKTGAVSQALFDASTAKFRYDQWVIDTVQRVADEKRATPTPASYEVVSSNGTIGSNLVPRLVRSRSRYDLLIASTNMREAQRQAASVQLGPQGDLVNKHWEVDHTLLDIVVIDEDSGQIAGRPWMTTILDRYSRCVVGYSLSFAPPSWTSVMDALRVALARKDKIVAHMGGIKNSWDCCGKPEVLITDRGRDFMSESLLQAARIVVFDLQHMKGRKPWLKGKIERWFRTMEEEVVHTLPGTTFANTRHREFYDSEGQAVLNIYELNWLGLKWVVDIYHHRRHSKLRRTPAQAWKDGFRDIPLPRAFPDELLIPMTGLVVSRTLRRDGIRFENLRWASDGFSALRRRPDIVDVQVRIDPLDLRKAYILDTVNNAWPTEAIGMTLNQWRTIERVRKKIQDEEDKDADVALGQARVEMDAYVKEVTAGKLKSKASKRLAEFKSNTAWSKVRQSIASDEDGIPGSHEVGVTRIASPPIQPVGPFKDPVRRRTPEPKAPPVKEAAEAAAEAQAAAAKSEAYAAKAQTAAAADAAATAQALAQTLAQQLRQAQAAVKSAEAAQQASLSEAATAAQQSQVSAQTAAQLAAEIAAAKATEQALKSEVAAKAEQVQQKDQQLAIAAQKISALTEGGNKAPTQDVAVKADNTLKVTSRPVAAPSEITITAQDDGATDKPVTIESAQEMLTVRFQQ